MKIHRPPLREIPLSSIVIGPSTRMITIDPGVWDKITRMAYADGWILLEIKNDRPFKAFQRAPNAN